jgi:transcriptional regulator with XRE-family HTH domain
MAKSINSLLDEIPPERRQRIEERVEAALLEMALQDLRKGRNLTQQDMARTLGLNQPALSKMEHQNDMNVSTLKRLVRAMGGKLKLVAEFPEGDVLINQFDKKH